MHTLEMPKSRLSYAQKPRLGDRIITISVGEQDNAKTFTVHEELIRAHSPFFERELGGDRKEAAERVVLLSKADPGAFAIYRDFIYRDYIFLNDDKNPVSSTALTLGLCYTLGDMLLDVNFKDAIVDVIIDLTKQGVYSFQLSRYAYEQTPLEWPLRQLLTALLICYGKNKWLNEEARAYLTKEALYDALNATFKNKKEYSLWGWETSFDRSDVCKLYHCHGTGSCYRVKLGLSAHKQT